MAEFFKGNTLTTREPWGHCAKNHELISIRLIA